MAKRNTAKTDGRRALVIVESPSKAKTIGRYLGEGYDVRASMGHVRDLPQSDLGIDLLRSFEPSYETLPEKRKVVGELKKAAAKVDQVYLATDLDREGEAIAWHLVHALDLDEHDAKRVVFNEITKTAIKEAFSHPREIDLDKVNAQQARRLLDRIVGYTLSPLLSKKIARNLSAGRVQSVAVRLVVEREREIRAFVPEESWRIRGVFASKPQDAAKLAEAWARFVAAESKDGNEPTVRRRNEWLSQHACLFAELIKIDGHEFHAGSVAEARRVAEAVGYVVEDVREQVWEQYAKLGLKLVTLRGRTNLGAAPAFTVEDVQTRRTVSRPNPPFTTAALQQAASTALGYAPSRTMRIAQDLYEGVDIGEGEGPIGLITYMRTDSTNLSQDAVNAVRGLIKSQFGDRYLPEQPNTYARGKRAQEAHEAIRPTDVNRTPASLKGRISNDQFRLYELIWQRFVACQMTPAQWDATTILIGADTSAGHVLFRASGRRLVFDGFQRVMPMGSYEETELPPLAPAARVAPLDVTPRQDFSSPPPRYSEASLIKRLEAEGIGRPSTYAPIIQTIQDRGYVENIERRLHATTKGEVVTDKLVEHFPKVMDVKFTSYMEDELDKIEEAHLDWVHVLNEFYEPFKQSLERAQSEMQPVRAEPSEYTCPECGRPMVYRWSRNGRFLSCSGYPECKTTMNVDREGKPVQKIVTEHPCPNCGRQMVLRRSKQGPFLGCSGYPECSTTMPCDDTGTPLRKVAAAELEDVCADCGSAMKVKFMRGRAMLACTNYPQCKAIKPLPEGVYVEKPKPEDAGAPCDKCGRPMVIRRSKRGPFLSCSGFPRCRNAMPMEKLDELKAKAAAGEVPPPPPPNGAGRNGKSRGKAASVPVESLGAPPPGFAWTRTGRPVVEAWPEDSLRCPECGSEMVLRNGRFGHFFGCTKNGCRFVANLRGEAKKRAESEMPAPPKPKPIPTEITCEECGSAMVIRSGRTGPFLGCSRYPKCKSTRPLPEGETVESLAAT